LRDFELLAVLIGVVSPSQSDLRQNQWNRIITIGMAHLILRRMMKRLLALGLLVGLTGSCAMPVHAQRMSLAEAQRQSAKEARKQQRLMKKNAKLQRKAQKRAAKAQQKSLRATQKADSKANRHFHR
jgi:hypothetical protein